MAVSLRAAAAGSAPGGGALPAPATPAAGSEEAPPGPCRAAETQGCGLCCPAREEPKAWAPQPWKCGGRGEPVPTKTGVLCAEHWTGFPGSEEGVTEEDREPQAPGLKRLVQGRTASGEWCGAGSAARWPSPAPRAAPICGQPVPCPHGGRGAHLRRRGCGGDSGEIRTERGEEGGRQDTEEAFPPVRGSETESLALFPTRSFCPRAPFLPTLPALA